MPKLLKKQENIRGILLMNKKIFLITLMLAISAFVVSAAPYTNDYQVNSRGYGFDARSFSYNAEQNNIFADLFQQDNTNGNQLLQLEKKDCTCFHFSTTKK